jgi:hypothetical protein
VLVEIDARLVCPLRTTSNVRLTLQRVTEATAFVTVFTRPNLGKHNSATDGNSRLERTYIHSLSKVSGRRIRVTRRWGSAGD